MKFLALLGVLIVQCTATKSCTNDSYPEQSFSVFGWISYLKRLTLVTLMLSGVVLYYIPESRTHARRICYVLIDITANFLKSMLGTQESDYVYEAIKSKYHQARYEKSLHPQKWRSREGQENIEDYERARVYSAKLKTSLDENGLRELREKKLNKKLSKDIQHSRHYYRSSIIRNSSDLRDEFGKPSYFYTNRMDDIQKYMKTNLRGVNRINGSVEDYALLISGSPRQMAMFDQKYEKDDVVLVEDPYYRIEFKECGTSTDRLSTKTEISASGQEGPTRDHNNHTESGIETYVKDVDLSFIPEAEVSRHFDYPELYQSSVYKCEGECCGATNRGSISSADINNREILNTELSNDTKNVLKSSKSMVNPKIHDHMDENYTNHDHGSRLLKSTNLNDRRVNFQNDEEIITQSRDDLTRSRNNILSRSAHRNKLIGHYSNNVPCFTDRDGEADDENSQHGRRIIAKHKIDDRPQTKSCMHKTYSDDSIFNYDDVYTKPILKNQFKPTLLRAVNWIFGGCPGASTRVGTSCDVVGKEEAQEFTGEWLL